MKNKYIILAIFFVFLLGIGYLLTKSIIGETIEGLVKEVDNETIILTLMNNKFNGERPNMNNNGKSEKNPQDSSEDKMPEDGNFPSFDGKNGPQDQKEKTIKLAKNTIIKNENGDSIALSDIKTGSIVTVKIVFGKVKEIILKQSRGNFNIPNMKNNSSSDEI